MGKIIILAICVFLTSTKLYSQYSGNTFNTAEKSDLCSHMHLKSARKITNSNAYDNYDLKHMKLDIAADNESTFISGNAILMAQALSDISTFQIMLGEQMSIDSIFVDGIKHGYSHSGDLLSMDFQSSIANNSLFEIQVYYSGDGNNAEKYAQGLYNTDVEGSYITYSFTQPDGASDWFPCKPLLRDKIDSLKVCITTPSYLKAASNGILKNTVTLENNMVRYEWESKHPIAFYNVAFNVAEYTEYNFYTKPEGFSDSIFVQNFLLSEDHIDSQKPILDLVPEVMEMYSNLFGLYPFHDEKYGHVIWGLGFGMEHQTLTSMPFTLDFRRMAHELSHQWFGNKLTCASWQDIWLNEGFASYFDYLAIKNLVSERSGDDRLQYYQRRAMEKEGGSVYVPFNDADNPNRVFTYRLTYCKAAVVVHMLRLEIGDDQLFWSSLNNYLTSFADSSASTEDFKKVLEETCNQSFDYFFDQWIYGEGYPTFDGTWNQNDDQLFLKLSQSASMSEVTPMFKLKVPVKLIFSQGGDTTVFVNQQEEEQEHVISMSKKVRYLYLNYDDEILAKSNLSFRPTDITPILANQVKVYPNPFSDKLFIEYKGENVSGRIYDAFGREILNFISENGKIELPAEDLPSGIYFIELKNRTGIEIRKIIKE